MFTFCCYRPLNLTAGHPALLTAPFATIVAMTCRHEAFLCNSCLQRCLYHRLTPHTGPFCRQEAFDGTGAAFVYPRGATLTVQRPAVAILGSGKVAFPMHKALGECA